MDERSDEVVEAEEAFLKIQVEGSMGARPFAGQQDQATEQTAEGVISQLLANDPASLAHMGQLSALEESYEQDPDLDEQAK